MSAQLVEELNKPVIEKFKRRKVYVRFVDNTQAVDLREIRSLSSKNKIAKYVYVSQMFALNISLNMHGLNL